MRKTIATFVAVIVMAVPSVAMAAPPEVLFDGTEEFSGEVPAGVLCDFAIQLDETVEVRVTAFYDNDGNPTTERVHIVGNSVWTTDYGTVKEHWALTDTVDLVAGTVTVTGNRWNGHSPGQGSVINGSGRLTFDFATGELTLNGPSQDVEGDYTAFCDVLAP
ncbi:MAG: hypothetical protein OEY55_12920 [Acidimicrobiia bacterium]|nr:hypothetical protein [Acidimicrobiia bacterium]MDH5505299.1 hypothetical protein [Acidimicrobiia bacterium]